MGLDGGGKNMRLRLVGCVLVLVASMASATKHEVEASMLVKGSIDIGIDGKVASREIEQEQKLPPAVLRLLDRSMATWQFDPILVDGKPARVRTPVSLLVTAAKRVEGDFKVRLRSVDFGGDKELADDEVSGDVLTPPSYPKIAQEIGMAGTVYLVIRIGRDGLVEDLMTEQVNLHKSTAKYSMDRMRSVLSDAALRAARKWTFKPPLQGEHANERFWSVRIPVEFAMVGDALPGYGEWRPYIPGPRQPIPWEQRDAEGFSPDTLTAGGIYPIREGAPRLVTSLDGS